MEKHLLQQGDGRAQLTEIAASSESVSASAREGLLGRVITKARIVSGQPQLDDVMMGLTVQTWDEALSAIPTVMLDRYYLIAVQAKSNAFPVSPLDIIAAWNNGQDAERFTPWPQDGYSCERAEDGSWKPMSPDRLTGLWPYGCDNWWAASEKDREQRNLIVAELRASK